MSKSTPVTDPADYVSAFMSLPVWLQSSCLSVVFAAADMEDGGAVVDGVLLVAKGPAGAVGGLPASHFIDVVRNVFPALAIARRTGWRG